MNISAPFIARPIATWLLAIAILLSGALGYRSFPVSALPEVDFPNIQVVTQLSGASPEFALNRSMDSAAQDVQAAINAAAGTSPLNLPYPPVTATAHGRPGPARSSCAYRARAVTFPASSNRVGWWKRP